MTVPIHPQVPENRCPRCQSPLKMVQVHGHGQCMYCKAVIDDCCQGETCQVLSPSGSDLEPVGSQRTPITT